MISLFIAATLAVVVYSLWVRRDTWWSRWEAAATFAIAMEGAALALASPWVGTELGPPLHRWTGVWNPQQVVAGLCLIVAIVANIYHMLVRLTPPDQALPIMRKHLLLPLGLGVVVMLATSLKIERGFQPDIFASLTGDGWLLAYELAGGGIALFLSYYLTRLMMLLRNDPRARTTVNLYLASMGFAVAACLIVAVSVWVGGYAGEAIWACACLSVGIFAYGLARSWQAKRAWFSLDAAARG